MMISRFTETIDFGEFDQKEVIMVLGHAHKFQTYIKANGMRVVFPGSIFFHELTDVDQEKGYVLIDESGNCTFEAIKGIREFVSYKVPNDMNAVEFFNGFRVPSNKFVFVSASEDNVVNEVELRGLLESKGCGFDRVRYKKAKDMDLTKVDVEFTDSNPLTQFTDFIDKKNPELDEVKRIGCEYLEKAGGVKG